MYLPLGFELIWFLVEAHVVVNLPYRVLQQRVPREPVPIELHVTLMGGNPIHPENKLQHVHHAKSVWYDPAPGFEPFTFSTAQADALPLNHY